MHGRRVRPLPPARQLGRALVAARRGHGLVERLRPLLVLAFEPRGRGRARENVAQVVEAGEAGADDRDPLVAEGAEGLAEAEEGGGRLRGEDGCLDDGDVGGWVDEFHRDEDAMVPAFQRRAVLDEKDLILPCGRLSGRSGIDATVWIRTAFRVQFRLDPGVRECLRH